MTTSTELDPIHLFFQPRSVAIVGATGDTHKLGWFIVENFINDYTGELFLVNRKGGQIAGKNAYTSISAIPHPIDMVVVAIPAKFVLPVITECADKGVKAVVVESGGFAEVSEEGKRNQEEIVKVAKANGMRVIGPNCIGVLAPNAGVDTIFISQARVSRPGPGPIAMMTQSGALGSAVLDAFTLEGDGNWISRFVSFGNASDVNEFDLLEYFGRDELTKIILAHLEGFRNGREFLKLAKKIGKNKPIVLLKAGRTSLGARASESHSGSLSANDLVVDALLRQHGIIRVECLNEMILLAKTLAKQPIPLGKKVGIVTDGGGFAVMASDAVEREGLELGELDKKTIENFKARYPSYYISNNPLDLTGTVTAEEFVYGIEQFALDPNIDAILTIIIPSAPQLDTRKFLELMTHYITEVKPSNSVSASKPILSVCLGGEESKIINSKFEKLDIPTFNSVEEAMRILKYLVQYRDFLNRGE